MVNLLFNPLHWGYNGTVTQHIGEKGTIKLQKKDGSEAQLHELISEEVTGLSDGSKFQLSPLIFTGILQTMYLAGGDFSKKFNVFYGRELFEMSDHGIASIDWVRNDWKKLYELDPATGTYNKEKLAEDGKKTHPEGWPRLHPRTRYMDDEEKESVLNDTSKPLIIVMHGLAGGSHEPIIRSLTEQLSNISNEKFKVAVLNTRGCARTKVVSPKLFYAFATEDLREFVQREHKRDPKRKIYAVGFSFGATMLANFLGEEGEKCLLSGAALVCNPWDLTNSAHKMREDFWSSRLFAKSITQFLVRTLEVNMNQIEWKGGEKPAEISPEHYSNYSFTRENLKKAKQFTDPSQFDDIFTAKAVGFEDSWSYYRVGSSINRLPTINVPTLVINSKDDPVIGDKCIPVKEAEENPHVLLIETDLGGHLAYLEKNHDSWATKQVAQYFDALESLVK
ncbi:medium-chain fatty acid ethyl ester synthase/esterase [Kluyveromyces lactis]|uniref:KLLA0E24201p n=1 Tax=Kluyveromyces lactis (strain ATCC 8585 / CBS 2359 / DSM 70799 / NBRC 1267 / NRRL Y-1140 / WM37) TaxID=284590 RepID=Q6CLZ7_KLULA|nr:uncharacterized protein KLLA0_E24201g [Kluyveromyces lactis]CAH00129.1 KLLA0E24201p [Kluyveromyces lactis]|eukprot:XP_455042.1 uncharacterized protein KLLA0_E24201g [Kluyveromyces lactis]